jgi:hypothetical protein
MAPSDAMKDFARGKGTPRAVIALALLVPAPTLGVLAGMVWWPGTVLGGGLFAASKVWILVLPALWRVLVDRQALSWSPVRHGGFGAGLFTGLILAAVIVASYLLAGSTMLDTAGIVARIQGVGISAPAAYAAGAAYWTLVNSALEEYVWRWFCVTRLEALVRPVAAVILSAAFFTLHHVIALAILMSPLPAALCSCGVFLGGLTWSWLFRRYRSIWPGYLSHALADVAIFALGAGLLFGR